MLIVGAACSTQPEPGSIVLDLGFDIRFLGLNWAQFKDLTVKCGLDPYKLERLSDPAYFEQNSTFSNFMGLGLNIGPYDEYGFKY